MSTRRSILGAAALVFAGAAVACAQPGAGDGGAGWTQASPATRADAPTMSEEAFEALARQVVQLYDENAKVWADDQLTQADKQKRSREIMDRVRDIYKQVSEGGRFLNASQAYQDWMRRKQTDARRRRVEQLREQLKVASDDEWTILSAKINAVLALREQVTAADQRSRTWSPYAKIQDLRVEKAKPEPDKKRIRALLDEIRAERAEARRECAELQAQLNAAQKDLIGLLTLEQEAVLVINQIVD